MFPAWSTISTQFRTIVFDLIPTIEKRVDIGAPADIERGVFVEGILVKRYRKEGQQFITVVVFGAATAGHALRRFDFPRIADPRIFFEPELGMKIDAVLSLRQTDRRAERNGRRRYAR